MIHIATVHWKTSKWITIQLRYLRKHLKSDFKVYAFLNGNHREYTDSFYYCCFEPIKEHAIKLDLLAERISWEGEEDDIIIFLDGDAFPISDTIVPFLESKLQNYSLIAIQRNEMMGDIQPHPSFCATTIRFWKSIKGDWNMGYTWKNRNGALTTDVGGNLLLQLNNTKSNWLPLHRTNKMNLHPLWFGVYEDLVYHHGAGFRDPFSRLDRMNGGLKINTLFWLLTLFRRLVTITNDKFEKSKLSIVKTNLQHDNAIYEQIRSDEFFYRSFMGD